MLARSDVSEDDVSGKMIITSPRMLWLKFWCRQSPGRPPRSWLPPFISAAFSPQAARNLGFRRNLTSFLRPEQPGRSTSSPRSASARAKMGARENPVPERAIGRDLILPGSQDAGSQCCLGRAGCIARCRACLRDGRASRRAAEACGNENKACGNSMQACLNVKKARGNPAQACLNENKARGNPTQACLNENKARGSPAQACLNEKKARGNPAQACLDGKKARGNLAQACLFGAQACRFSPPLRLLTGSFSMF